MEASEGDLLSRGYGAVLWEPDDKTVRQARVTRFMSWLEARHQLHLGGYEDLWQWSVSQPGEFWSAVWDYFEVLGDRGEGPALAGQVMPDVRWFDGATLNYARNALRTAWTDPDRTAIIFDSERGRAGSLSYAQLAAEVARVARGLRSLGVGRGDRVAALLPNVPEAVIGLLATASLGAIWSSCSPDFGARSVIDRFAQIEPKVLIACDGYGYGGKEFSRAVMVDEVVTALPGSPAVVLVSLISVSPGGRPPQTPPILGGNLSPQAPSAPPIVGGNLFPQAPWPPRPPLHGGTWALRSLAAGETGASRSSRRCRSRTRSGWSTPRALPGCRSRSCTVTAASSLSTSRRSRSIRTCGRATSSPGTPRPAG